MCIYLFEINLVARDVKVKNALLCAINHEFFPWSQNTDMQSQKLSIHLTRRFLADGHPECLDEFDRYVELLALQIPDAAPQDNARTFGLEALAATVLGPIALGIVSNLLTGLLQRIGTNASNQEKLETSLASIVVSLDSQRKVVDGIKRDLVHKYRDERLVGEVMLHVLAELRKGCGEVRK